MTDEKYFGQFKQSFLPAAEYAMVMSEINYDSTVQNRGLGIYKKYIENFAYHFERIEFNEYNIYRKELIL